jgi:hypothetical protein
MAIGFRAAGTSASGIADPSTAVGLPAGIAAGDLLVLAVTVKLSTVTINAPDGWTAPPNNTITGGTGAAGADIGTIRTSIFTRVVVGGETAPVVDFSAAPSPWLARTFAYTKAANETWATVLCTGGADTTGSATLYGAVTGAANLAVTTGDWIGAATGINGDAGTPTTPGTLAATGATLGTAVNRANSTATVGNQSRLLTDDRPVTAGPETAAPTYQVTFSAANAGMSGGTIFYRLRVDTATAPRLEEVAADAEDTSNQVALTAAVTIAAGDLIVVKASSPRGDASAYNLPTATGLTFTLRASEYTQANHNRAAIWTAVAATALGATTITWTWAGASNFHSMIVERWSGAQLDATPATQVAFGTASLPSTTLTTEAANSVVTMLNTDWVPTNPAARVWVTTSASDAQVWEPWLKYLALNYWTAYAYMRTGAAGSKTLGMSAPSGQNWTILALELQAVVPDFSFVKGAQGDSAGAATSTTATFAASGTAAAGNLLVSAIAIDKSIANGAPPAGWTLEQYIQSASVTLAVAWKVAAGGETGITWTHAGTTSGCRAYVAEYATTLPGAWSLLGEANEPTDEAGTETGTGTGTTTSITASVLAAAASAVDSGAASTGSWGGGYATRADSSGDGSGRAGLGYGDRFFASSGTISATFTNAGNVDQWSGAIVVFGRVAAGAEPHKGQVILSRQAVHRASRW